MLFKNGMLCKLVAAAFFGLLAMPVFAQPSCLSSSSALTANNLVRFEVATSRDVANNEVTAHLVKNATAKTAKALADKINPIINQSLAIAKKYPSVVVATGSQNAYPSYDKGSVTGFNGSAALILKSQDIEAITALISELQPLLVLNGLDSSVSPALYDATQASLMSEAVSQFQTQATLIAHAWGATSYKLVEANMNTNLGGNHRFVMPASMGSAKFANEAMSIEAADTTVTYRIDGTIELVK